MPKKPTRHTEHGPAGEDPLRYATGYHAPVLYKAVVELLVTDPSGCYVDATLGGGGHSAALLEALGAGGRVIGVDQDADALETARARLATEIERGRFETLRGNFGDLAELLARAGALPIDGLLLDLGVSSYQLDTATRGFSYREEGALDMRMDDRRSLDADQVVNAWDESALRRILYEYGEESRAGRIARAIVEARPIASTHRLADVVRGAVPTRDELKTLSRVFQAIRIAVNAELDVLERVLAAAVDVVRPGGRIAVISYHSLEDRRVKRFLRYGNFEGEPVRDFYGHLVTPWQEVTRKPIEADDAEVAANPRARSARLRVAERVETRTDPAAPEPSFTHHT